jgi:hypothetical protein
MDLERIAAATEGQVVNRFLAIVGASGSGKSSVARAVGQGALALSDLIEGFQKKEKTLHLIVRQSLPENAPERRLVILVDQFEEIFTLCRKDELREALVRNLLYAANVAQGQTLVILTVRADFYAKCAANAELAAAFSDHHVLVGPMTEDELR